MLNLTQIILLTIVALSGIPLGLFIKRYTLEEMKPGRKWFSIIAFAAGASIVLSPVFLSDNNLAISWAILVFILLLSWTSGVKKNGKRR